MPIFQMPENEEQFKAMSNLDLNSFGLTDLQWRSITAHQDLEIKLIGFKPRLGGVMGNGILYSQDECLKDKKNWRVVAARIAPYETILPGSKTTWTKFAQNHDLSTSENIIQIRLSIKPQCPLQSDSKSFATKDQALHFIYNVLPTDAQLRDGIIGSVHRFNDLIGSNQDGTNEAIAHLKAINSKSYRSFRLQVLKDFYNVVKARYQSNRDESEFRTIENEGSSVKSKLYGTLHTELLDLSHPLLKLTQDGQTSLYFRAMVSFLHKYALPDSLFKLTGFRAASGESWFFSNWNPRRGINGDELQHFLETGENIEQAKEVYAGFAPLPLITFDASIDHDKIQMTELSGTDFYQDADILFVNKRHELETEPAVNRILTAKAKENDYSLFLKNDYLFQFKPIEYGRNPNDARIPFKKSINEIAKQISNIRQTTSDTTTCTSCHASQHMTDFSGHLNIDDPNVDGGINLHMLGAAARLGSYVFNPRTLLESDIEAAQLNKSLSLFVSH